MAKQVLTNLDFNSVARIINLPDGTDPQHPATVAQLNAFVEGLSWKSSVRAASTGNVNLASPGNTFDGVTVASNDRILIKDQTAASENGIYIWNGSATQMTRAADASTFDELESAVVSVQEGTTLEGTNWRQTQVNGTIDTDDVEWETFGANVAPASETTPGIIEIATQAEVDAGVDDTRAITPAKLAASVLTIGRYSTPIGDGSANQYTVTHNFNSRDVHAKVYRASGAYDEVICDLEYTTVNTITVRFAASIASNAFIVSVKN